MTNMTPAIQPKSDQLNSDSLISGPITIKITRVTITPGEQPVSIYFDGDNGKPYRPCKSMMRAMVYIWGPEAKHYTGRLLTLFRDKTVTWGGMQVGGIRISHASHIDGPVTMALTASKTVRKLYTIQPLKMPAPVQHDADGVVTESGAQSPPPPDDAPAATAISGHPDVAVAAGALEDDSTRLERKADALMSAAKRGRAALNAEWKRTSKADGDAFGGINGQRMAEWKRIAAEADAIATPTVMGG